MTRHRILILVTHLLGSGHLSRALTLARAFLAAGHDVRVVSGGMPAPQLAAGDVPLVQLAPLRSDGTDFTRLLTGDGSLAGPDVYAARIAQLLETVSTFAPTCVITELFPFGRRSLRDEFTALLEHSAAMAERPRIFASVRDILAPPSKPKKAAFALDMVTRFYDGVLVHSDQSIVPLDLSWPVSDGLAAKLRYTGFVAPALPDASDQSDGRGAILVSAGGGAVGARLYHAALDAAQGDANNWRILIGGHTAARQIAELQPKAPHNVILEPARPDFRSMLQVAKASISLCGYNTAMDVLQTGIPAVMAAFDDGAEVEQTLRIKALDSLPRLHTMALNDVTPQRLRAALDSVLSDDTPRPLQFGFDGAARTVAICTGEAT